MSQDFTTVLVKDSRLVCTDKLSYAVEKSGQNVTPQVYNAISANSSSITFNLQVPSEQVILDLRAIWESTITLKMDFPAASVPVGQYPLQYGLTDALAPFPAHQLCTTQSITINNNTVSQNTKDVLPALLSMVDKRNIMRYNGMTPNMTDNYANYSDAVGAVNNPLGGYSNIGDNSLHPRGTFNLDFIGTTGGDPIAVSDGTAQTYYVTFTTREPLTLSPFRWASEEGKGFYGIQNMNMVFNLGPANRVWRSASPWFDGTTNITVSNITSKLIMTQLTPHPSDLLPSRCVNNYYTVPRYITTVPNPIAGAYTQNAQGVITVDPRTQGTVITSTNIQLNMIPDKVIIFIRKTASTQQNNTPDYFASIRGISIQFNNQAGILSTASVSDLYRYSVESGSNQSWEQFYGLANKPNPDPSKGALLVPTTGSILVLEMGRHIQINDDVYAPGSLGSFQFQFNVNAVDQTNSNSSNWEMVLITVNSGIFVTERGTASSYQGILTRQNVLDTSTQEPYSSHDVKRMIGGGFFDTLKSTMGKVGPKLPGLVKQGLSMIDNPYAQKGAKVIEALGYGRSGGGSSGGGSSGGRRHKLEEKLM